MKLTIKREPFLRAFNRAAAAVPARHVKDILTNMLLSVGPDASYLAGTDLEVSIKVSLGAQEITVDDPGGVLLPAALFRSIVSECSDESLLLRLEKNSLIVAGERAKHSLRTIPADDFPSIQRPDNETAEIELPTQAAVAAIKAVLPCTDDATKYAINCINVAIENDRAIFSATEGHMLGTMELKCGGKQKPQDVLLPNKAAASIVRCAAGQNGDATLGLSANWLRFSADGTDILARLGEGRFPNRESMLHGIADCKIQFDIPAGILKHAIRQSSFVNNDQFNRKATLKLSAGQLDISAVGDSTGNSTVTVPIGYDGPEFEAAVNWSFVLTALGGFEDSDTVLAKFSENRMVLTHGDLLYFIVLLSKER